MNTDWGLGDSECRRSYSRLDLYLDLCMPGAMHVHLQGIGNRRFIAESRK